MFETLPTHLIVSTCYHFVVGMFELFKIIIYLALGGGEHSQYYDEDLMPQSRPVTV